MEQIVDCRLTITFEDNTFLEYLLDQDELYLRLVMPDSKYLKAAKGKFSLVDPVVKPEDLIACRCDFKAKYLEHNFLGEGMKAVEYTGDAAVTQEITGLGFKPKFIIVYPQVDGEDVVGFKADNDLTKTFLNMDAAQNNYYDDDHIISFEPDGFIVGDGTGSAAGNQFNVAARKYTAVCFQNVVTMSYTGDGAATQAVVGAGIRAGFGIIYPKIAGAAGTYYAMKARPDDGLDTFIVESGAGGTDYENDMIISFDVDGFTVGDGTPIATNYMNVNAREYTVILWETPTIAAYTGDAAATQDITGTGIAPTFALIYPHITDGGYVGLKTKEDDTKAFIERAGAADNCYEDDHVISLDADGFTVGDGTGGTANFLNVGARDYTALIWAEV